MARRHIYKAKEIYRLRSVYWARYYHFRNFAKASGIEPVRVMNALVGANMPEPEIEVTGEIYEPLDVKLAQSAALSALGVRDWLAGETSEISISWKDLMHRFFWTEDAWMCYVRLYEALPDPVEDHYLVYDRKRDGGRLVPMSSKPKRGGAVPDISHNPVDNLGTSQVQVSDFRYKSGVLVALERGDG